MRKIVAGLMVSVDGVVEADYGIGHGHATALVGHVLAQRAAEGTPQQPEHASSGKHSA
jgi:hypothetical protein